MISIRLLGGSFNFSLLSPVFRSGDRNTSNHDSASPPKCSVYSVFCQLCLDEKGNFTKCPSLSKHRTKYPPSKILNKMFLWTPLVFFIFLSLTPPNLLTFILCLSKIYNCDLSCIFWLIFIFYVYKLFRTKKFKCEIVFAKIRKYNINVYIEYFQHIVLFEKLL